VNEAEGWSLQTPVRAVDAAVISDLPNDAAAGVGGECVVDYDHVESILHRNTFTPAEVNVPSHTSGGGGDAMSHGVSQHGALGIWLLPSFFNHSCAPNCIWYIVGDVLFIRTIRDIAPNEELLISYADCAQMSFVQRQVSLSRLGFQCRCVWCTTYIERPALFDLEDEMLEPKGALVQLQDEMESMRVLIVGLTSQPKREKQRPKLVALIDRMQQKIDEMQQKLHRVMEAPSTPVADAVNSNVAQVTNAAEQLRIAPASTPTAAVAAASSPSICFALTHLYPSYFALATLLSLHLQLAFSNRTTSTWKSIEARLEQLMSTLHSAATVDALITGDGHRSNLLARLDSLRLPCLLLSNQLLDDAAYRSSLITRIQRELRLIVSSHARYYGLPLVDTSHFLFWYGPTLERCLIDWTQLWQPQQ
jgi:hypothetical protein